MGQRLILSIVAILLSTVTNAYASSSAQRANSGCQNTDSMIHQSLLF